MTQSPGGASRARSTPGARIVALGGGTGLPILLRGLRELVWTNGSGARGPAERQHLTGIVTVADDGGSSGRLRRDYGILAPGDIRNCLLALSPGDRTLAALFGYRFNGHGEIAGHNLGNLMLAALIEMESEFPRAVDRAGDMLGARGQVLPATATAVALAAEFEDGSRLEGETRIASARKRIRRVFLRPEHAPALPRALAAVAAADCLVVGPGSLYTSLIPVLLVRGLADAIARAGVRVVVVMNLMSEPGETDGYTAQDHLLALQRHAPQLPIHDVIVHDTPVPRPLRERYGAEDAVPVAIEPEALRARGWRVWTGDLLAAGPKVRHDPQKLARVVLDLAGKSRHAAGGSA